MIGELFYWVANMSVVATVSGMLVWALGHVRRIPARIIWLLWCIPFFRLTVPVGINSRYSLMTWLSELSTVTSVKSVPLPAVGEYGVSMTNCIQIADGYFPLTFEDDLLSGVFLIGGMIWLAVAVCLLTATAVTYRLQTMRIADARHWRDDLYVSDAVSSPTVYGILRPKIVLPKEYDEETLSLILRHEAVHIRRKDNLWRAVALTVACVHWFNPAVWLFFKSFSEQTELSCDEAVLRRLPKEEAASYARLLLSHAQVRPNAVSPLGGGNLKRRIVHILSYRRLSVLATVSSSLLVIVCAVVLMTNRM